MTRLAVDVPTRWGTWARGTSVRVLRRDETTTVIELSTLPIVSLKASVPHHFLKETR